MIILLTTALVLFAPLVLFLTSPFMTIPLTIALEVLLFVAIGSILIERKLERSWTWFSPSATASVLYPVHFALPFVAVLFKGEQAFYLATPEALTASVWVVAAGLLFHAAGYMFVRSISRRPTVADVGATGDGARSRWALLVILVVLDLLGKAIRIIYGAYFQTQIATQGDVPAELWPFVMMLSSLGFGAFALAYSSYLQQRSGGGRWGKAAAFIWAYSMLFNIPTGRKESVLYLLLLPVMIRALLRKPFRSRLALPVLAAAVLAVFALTGIYRAGMQATAAADGTVSAATIADMFERGRAVRGGDDSFGEVLGSGVSEMLARLSLIESVYVTLEDVSPDARLNGESIWWVVASIAVPRALWPEKPAMHLGNDFGRRYGFIASNDTVTSVSVTYIGEFIWNFGAWGALLMLGLGALNALLFSRVLAQRTSVRVALYSLIWLPIAYVGGEFAMYYAGILKTIATFAVLWWIARVLAQSRIRSGQGGVRAEPA